MEWNDNDEKQDIPYVHLWLQFKYLKPIYPVDKKVVVTVDDLKNEDPNRWVEIPDDFLKLQINELNESNTWNNNTNVEITNIDISKQPPPLDTIVVEYIQFINDDIKSDNNESKKFKWPRALNDNEWKNFKVGQIVDIQDTQQSKWYEAMIRKVIKRNNDDNNDDIELVLHYIGWAVKWDEQVKSIRAHKRHTHTKCPHRPNRNRRRYYNRGF